MPAPSQATYAVAIKAAANQAVVTRLDQGAGPATIKFRSALDLLLGAATLADPCGVVDGDDGALDLIVAAQPTGVATDVIAYAEVCDGDGVPMVAVPAEAGTTSVAGRLVMESLDVQVGVPFSLLTARIP